MVHIFGDFSFIGCTELKEIKFNKSVSIIGDRAFDETKWAEEKKAEEDKKTEEKDAKAKQAKYTVIKVK